MREIECANQCPLVCIHDGLVQCNCIFIQKYCKTDMQKQGMQLVLNDRKHEYIKNLYIG